MKNSIMFEDVIEVEEETEFSVETDVVDDIDNDNLDTTFTVNDKQYEIVFNLKRINLYERAGHKPIVASFAQNGGSFSLDELMSLVAFGTRPVGGAGYVSPKQGMAMAERLIQTNGYAAVFEIVGNALERDCGFFFKVE